jgi:NADH:ubiquinone oxidoreductase subunit
MSWLRLVFVWWRGATPGTLLTTWWSGRAVGRDAFGNRYYENRGGARRWVIYNGTVEASRVPAEWHGWLHHTFGDPPTVAPLRIRSWEKEHVPNMTGTANAYHPAGSLAASGEHAPATGDYQSWKPEGTGASVSTHAE